MNMSDNNSRTFYSQSNKEIFRDDIELAKKPRTLYKLWEYFDDYSYSGSNQIGLLLREEYGKKFMYLAQPIGPTPEESRKLLEFRRSGDNGEIGHRGGGNKVNIYGHSANRVEIYIHYKCDLYKSETYPNAIYNFATDEDITEDNFRARIDSSEFQTIKKKIEKREIPPWYTVIYDEIKSALGFEPNYLMAFEFDEAPIDFTDNDKWNEFIALTRAKQYEPKIYFKNEIVGMRDFKTYENIDLLGRISSDSVRENEMVLSLYVLKGPRGNNFYIKIMDKFYSLDNEEEITITDGFKQWGIIRMFCINIEYFNKNLKELNKYLVTKLSAENFYGVYFDKINSKLINPVPKAGSLGTSKNNKIISGTKNSAYFRMVFEPLTDCTNETLETLTSTDKVKAETYFGDDSKTNHSSIIEFCKRRYQGKELKSETKKKRKEAPPKPISKKKA